MFHLLIEKGLFVTLGPKGDIFHYLALATVNVIDPFLT